jgi:hypothetical protein
MEGLEMSNGKVDAEEEQIKTENKAKSKTKAKKSKKASKRAEEDTKSLGVAETGSVENTHATGQESDIANTVNTDDENETLLEDVAKSYKKANGTASRRKKSANIAAKAEIKDHSRGGEDIEVEPTDETLAFHDDATSEDLAQPPRKMKKAKIAKSRKLAGDFHTRSQEDGSHSDEALHQPLTPARTSHYPTKIYPEDSPIVSSLGEEQALPRMATSDGDQEGDQQQPSEKALGKRKAVDEPVKRGPNKRARKTSSKESHGQDLRQMLSSQRPSDEHPRVQVVIGNTNLDATSSKRASRKLNKPTVDEPQEVYTQDNEDNSENQISEDKTKEQPELPFEAALLQASETRKRRKRRLPVDEDESGPSSTSMKATRFESQASRAKTPRTPRTIANATGTASASTPKSSLTVEDTTAISQAIGVYREFNDMTQYQVNQLIQQPAQSVAGKALWKSIYEEVPSLSRRSIHQFCRRNFHNFEGRGVWTEEQDEELRDAYQRNPNKWKTIGEELNRFPEDVRDRWRNYLVCEGNMKKAVWDKVEEAQLITAVEECIDAVRKERRRAGATPPSFADEDVFIDWQKVSEKLNHTRSRLQCSYKWKKLKALNASDEDGDTSNPVIGLSSWRVRVAKTEARTLTASEKLRLLRAIDGSGAGREGKIPWAAIALEMNEKGKRMTWKVCFRTLKNNLPGSGEMTFKEIVKRLVDIFAASVPNEPDGFEMNPILSPSNRGQSTSAAIVNDTEADPQGTGSGERRVSRSTSSKLGHKSKAKSKKDKNLIAQIEEGQSSVAKTSRKSRDRMRSQDQSALEPPEVSSAVDESISIDVDEDIMASFEVVKARKGKSRNSRSRKFLSEEKVVEESSDDENATNDQIDQGHIEAENDDADMVVDNSSAEIAVKIETIDNRPYENESVDLDNDSGASPDGFDNHNHSSLDEDESDPESADETGSMDLDEDHTITANGFEGNGGSDVDEDETASATSNNDTDNVEKESVPQDTQSEGSNKKLYHRLADQHVETYFENTDSDSESVNSSDSSVSSIPAKVRRNTSLEL